MAILDLAFVFRSRVDSTKLHEKLNYLHLIFLTMTGFDAKYGEECLSLETFKDSYDILQVGKLAR